MAEKPTSRAPAKRAETREDRLKAALKANLARRKAQNRARATGGSQKKPAQTGQKGD